MISTHKINKKYIKSKKSKTNIIQLRGRKNVEVENKKGFERKIINVRDLPKNEDDTWDWLIRMGFIDGNALNVVNCHDVNNMLEGKPLVVIGSGFSGRGVKWEYLDNIHTLGINHIIDIYHNLDYLIFQDHRFLRLNKYPLHEFKGIIFVANSNPASKKFNIRNIRPFVPLGLQHNVSTRIEKGLYARKSTGLCAVNLALIMGANPIYLVGLDNPKDWEQSFTNYSDGAHIHKEYKGSVNTKKALDGYLPVLKYYRNFINYKHRIINVCENGMMDWFKQISISHFNDIIKYSKKKEEKEGETNETKENSN